MSSLSSLPSTPVPAATAVQARSVAPDDRSPAPSDRSTAPSTSGAAINDGSTASGQANTSDSFGSVLEAQLGSLSGSKGGSPLQPAADGVTPEAKTEKSKPDVDSSVAGPPAPALFLPINVPLVQPVLASASGDPGDAILAARDTQQGVGGRGEPQMPSRIGSLAEAIKSEPGISPIQGPLSGESKTASFADTLQSLPLLDHASKHDVDLALASQAGAPESVTPPLSALTAEHRLDTTRAPEQSNIAIPGTVGESGWDNAFSQRVSWMVGQQVQSAEFRVTPPQLGPIEVKVSITNDQASLTFVASHAAARDAIQMSLPRLQEMLLESGVSLGNVFVGAQTPQNQHDTGMREHASAGAPGDIGATTGTASSGIDVSLSARRLLGLVDLYA